MGRIPSLLERSHGSPTLILVANPAGRRGRGAVVAEWCPECCRLTGRSPPVSLHPGPVPPIPDDTARVARAAFPGGNPYLRMRDELGTIFEDAQFGALFPARGRPAEAPWRLTLVT